MNRLHRILDAGADWIEGDSSLIAALLVTIACLVILAGYVGAFIGALL